jgi:hypothetical protein
MQLDLVETSQRSRARGGTVQFNCHLQDGGEMHEL